MALYRTGLYVKNHSVEKVQVAKTPIASFNGNVTGLYIPELIAYITAKQSGSGTPSPDNIRPIIGWSECNVVRCGKNMFDLNYLSASGITIQNGEASGTANNFNAAFGTSTDGLKSKFKFKPNTSYTISFKAYTDGNSLQSGNGLAIYFRYTDNTNLVITAPNNTLNYTYFSMTSLSSKSLGNILISYGTSGANIWHISDIQLEENASATAYEPYTGNTYTIQLGDTYYGGSLDVTTGVLTITHGYIEYDGSEDENWVYQNNGYTISRPTGSAATSAASMCYSNQAVRTGDTSMPNGTIRIGTSNVVTRLGTGNNDVPTYKAWLAEHPLQLVYPLATPITVQLSPTQIEQLLGANNVWCDTGDVEVKFYNVVR